MKKSTLLVLDLLNFSVCFYFAGWLFMNFLFTYSLEIFNFPASRTVTVLINLSLILVLTAFCFICIRLLYLRRLNPKHLFFLYGVYFVLLFYLLFLKNIGLQSYKLNPLTYFDGIPYGFWFEPVMNLLMFIPVSLLFKMTLRRALLALICLVAVETIQYVGHLGVFDMGDLLANFLSLMLGQLIRRLLFSLGLERWLDLHRSSKSRGSS